MWLHPNFCEMFWTDPSVFPRRLDDRKSDILVKTESIKLNGYFSLNKILPYWNLRASLCISNSETCRVRTDSPFLSCGEV
jgi:hypothetical protein